MFKMRRKILPVLVSMMLFSNFVLAEGKKKKTPPKKGPGKVLHVAFQQEFQGNYDPVVGDHFIQVPLFHTIYSTLFRLNEDLKPYPFLLESYQQDGVSVVLTIKKNARFSDGKPVTAEDAVRSIELGMTQALYPCPVYHVIEGGELFFRGETKRCSGLRVLGPKRFEIKLLDENVPLSHYLTSPLLSILPRARKRPVKLKKMAFSGAFKVVEQRIAEREAVVVLERNEYFTGKKSNIDTLYFHFYRHPPDFDSVVHKGEPDLFLYDRYQKIPVSRYKYNYFKTPIFGAYYFKLNARAGPFKDKRLRTFFKQFILSWKIASATGWELIAPTKLLLPHSLTGYSLFTNMAPGAPSKWKPPEKVKVICVNAEGPIRRKLFMLLEEKLKPFNIELELQWIDYQELVKREIKGDFDMTFYFFVVDVPLSSYFYETLFTPGSELNRFGYEVPAALKLLTSYGKEKDELARLRILARLERIAQEESFVIPLMSPLTLVGYKEHIKNVRMDKYMLINFEAIDVQEKN
jgi:ABC-type oligopeptide transport system substrate-binding subunit